MIIGYARCSTEAQDLAAQKDGLEKLGAERIYSDQGLTGANRKRPGLAQALAAVRAGDTFVVTKLDRLGRSARDLDDIAQELQAKGVKLSFGGSVYDPTDPMGRMFFQILAAFAEFEHGVIRMRTKEGMAMLPAGKLQGKPPSLSPTRAAHLRELHEAGQHNISQLAELFGVSRATVYRTLEREMA